MAALAGNHFPRAVSGGVRYFFAVAGCAMIQSLCFIAGLVLLVVPGLVSLVRFYPMAAVYIYERPTETKVLTRTLEVTRGAGWPIGMAVATFTLFLLSLSVLVPSSFIGSGFPHLEDLWWLVIFVLTQVTCSLFTALSFVIYREFAYGKTRL